MAASMRGPSKLKLSRTILKLSHRLKSQQHPHETRYFVALPDIPSDTSETNSLLRYNDPPKFDVTPGRVLTGTAKTILDYDVELEKHKENLKGNPPQTFEDMFDPLEKARVPMWCAHHVGQQMFYSSSEYKLGLVCDRNEKQISRAENDRWRSRTIYESVKTVNTNRDSMKPYQQRLIDMYLYNSKIHGTEIKKVKKYDEMMHWMKMLQKSNEQFSQNLDSCYRLYMRRIEKRSELGSMPDKYLALMVPPGGDVSKGPYNLTMDPVIYHGMMQHCSNGFLRRDIWEKYNGLAGPDYVESYSSNGQTINDIRAYRQNIAELIGYKNFAEAQLQRRMVGSVENLANFLNGMRTSVLDKAKNDVALIQEFAAKCGLPGKLQPWDYEFFKSERKRYMFNFQENEVAQYFPYQKIKENMMQICTDLFGVQFKQITDCDKLYPTVEVYQVIEEDGSEAGTIHIDPFRRPSKFGGSYTHVARDHSDVMDTKPLVFMSLNFQTPINDSEPCLLTLEDVYTMFGEFGCTLQHVLAKSPYSELAGSNNLEKDAADICFHVLKEMALEPSFIKQLSSHHSTGEPVPERLLDTVLKAARHMIAYDVSKELYLSALDLELCIKTGIWYPHMERIWKLYMPTPLHEEDYHPCHMTDMFPGEKACGYYTNLWTQMIATDIFKTFQETGFEDKEKIAAVGRRVQSLKGDVNWFGGKGSVKDLVELYQNQADEVLLVTSAGELDVELWSKEAPKACRNFVQLCMEGYYDGTIFHRVVPDFIVQGGDPTGTGEGGESIYGKPFKDEFHSRLRFVRRGLVAMANAGKNDNGSQFFITMGQTQELQNKHTIFGKVTGNTVYNLSKLQEVEIDDNERPVHPHKIKSAMILSNPYDDIVPRNQKKEKSDSEKKSKSKSQSKATKNFKLLSFGEEAEEDEVETDLACKDLSAKGKSSHDLLDDPTLSTESAVQESKGRTALPEDVKSDNDDEKSSEDEEQRKKMKDSIKEKLKGDKKSEQPKKDTDEKDDSKTKALKLEAKRLRRELKGLDKEEKEEIKQEEKKPPANDLVAAYMAEKEKYKNIKKENKKGKGSREELTLAMLSKFQSKLSAAKLLGGSYSDDEEEEKEEDKEKEYKKEEEEAEDEGDSSWQVLLRHKLQFEDKKRKVIDANIADEDRYEIYDPRNPLTKRRREMSKNAMKDKNSKQQKL
ncbi:hypothetical protein FSP39_016306 [Pinctada imbricata]|uniref:Spliceosome-associated protein CWC27 homolog n=1 Tax=Pinctada imbricata TaxID=66713 RepID=A0AA88XSN7_PINIB|nr:hypothetical protein FSP39_016306 [Pinctada imbricata]